MLLELLELEDEDELELDELLEDEELLLEELDDDELPLASKPTLTEALTTSLPEGLPPITTA